MVSPLNNDKKYFHLPYLLLTRVPGLVFEGFSYNENMFEVLHIDDISIKGIS